MNRLEYKLTVCFLGFLLLLGSSPKVKAESWKCLMCRITVSTLYDFVDKPYISDDCIASIIDYLCQTLNIEDANVCKGITNVFKENYIYIYTQLFVNRGQLCESLLPHDCDPIHTPKWNVKIPGETPEYKELPLPHAKAPKFRVLHFTDLHFDNNYLPGADAVCNEPLCCRTPPPKNGSKVAVPAGKWGTLGKCDVPVATVENMFQHLSKEKLDYIIWTGDIPSHNIWSQSKESQLSDLDKVFTWFKKYFPNIPIYSAVGNHESVPVDNFPPQWAPKKYKISWLYDNLAENWPKFAKISKSQVDGIRWRSSYSVYAQNDLKIISINTQYCEDENKWLLLNATDPDQTLEWLVEELLEAERKNAKVHIIGHIPPGLCLVQWSWNYYDIVNRFANTIRGQFFGHTHVDEFKLYFEDADITKKATGVAFIAPSVTTFGGMNPAYRIYEIDGHHQDTTYAVLNYDTWFLNITATGNSPNPIWTHEYNFKKAYGLESLSPKSMENLVKNLAKKGKLMDLFLKYYQRAPFHCDSKCISIILCQIRKGRAKSSDRLCHDLPQHFKQNHMKAGKPSLAHAVLNKKIKASLPDIVKTCSKKP